MNLRRSRLGRRWLGVPLALALLALAWGMSGSAQADDSGFRITLNARGDGVTCDEPSEPTECVVPLAGSFTLAVELFEAPAEGYIVFSSQIDFHGLTWVPAASADENVWPDNALPLRSPDAPGFMTPVVGHGGLTATSKPFPISHYEGAMVEMTLTCTPEASSVEVALVNWDPSFSPIGASVTLANGTMLASKTVGERNLDLIGDGNFPPAPVADVLDISCEEVPPTPTPTSQPAAAPTPTPGLPGVGAGAGDGGGGDARLTLFIVGVLVAVAAVLGLSGWRLAERRPN